MDYDPKIMAALSRPAMLAPAVFPDLSLAEDFFKRLQRHIARAEKEAEAGEQLTVYYDTPAGERIRVAEIGWHNPSLIILYGNTSTGRSRVLVHQESLSLVLQYEQEVESPVQKNRVGFHYEEAEEPSGAGDEDQN